MSFEIYIHRCDVNPLSNLLKIGISSCHSYSNFVDGAFGVPKFKVFIITIFSLDVCIHSVGISSPSYRYYRTFKVSFHSELIRN